MDTNEEVVMSQEAHNAIVEKATATAAVDAKALGVTEGRKAERDRFAAVLADEKVKGKEVIALDLAIKSPDMAASDVVSFVAGLPSAEPAKSPTIDERMAGQGVALALGGAPIKAPLTASGWDKVISSKFKR